VLKCISAGTADELWTLAAQALLDGTSREGRGGRTLELLHVGLSLSSPINRWVSARTPPINPAFSLVEAVWILAGRRDSALPTFWNPALPRYAGAGSEFHGAYGWRLRNQFGLDQIDRAVSALRSNPDTRQVVLQIWDPRVDFPTTAGVPSAPDIPCNISSFLKIRGDRLEWLQVMRSNDVFLGTPHNIVQFTILQEIIAGRLGIAVGSYDVAIDSLHVYSRDLVALRNSLQATSLAIESPPRFGVPEKEWDETLAQLVYLIDGSRLAVTPAGMLELLRSCAHLPADWPSAVAIVVADAARRRGWDSMMNDAVQACSNGCLRELWNRWFQRISGAKRQASVSSISNQ